MIQSFSPVVVFTWQLVRECYDYDVDTLPLIESDHTADHHFFLPLLIFYKSKCCPSLLFLLRRRNLSSFRLKVNGGHSKTLPPSHYVILQMTLTTASWRQRKRDTDRQTNRLWRVHEDNRTIGLDTTGFLATSPAGCHPTCPPPPSTLSFPFRVFCLFFFPSFCYFLFTFDVSIWFC